MPCPVRDFKITRPNIPETSDKYPQIVKNNIADAIFQENATISIEEDPRLVGVENKFFNLAAHLAK